MPIKIFMHHIYNWGNLSVPLRYIYEKSTYKKEARNIEGKNITFNFFFCRIRARHQPTQNSTYITLEQHKRKSFQCCRGLRFKTQNIIKQFCRLIYFEVLFLYNLSSFILFTFFKILLAAVVEINYYLSGFALLY